MKIFSYEGSIIANQGIADRQSFIKTNSKFITCWTYHSAS